MAIADASVSDEEKSKMKTAVYVATTDSPESFTTELASGTDLSGNSKTATDTFVCPASGNPKSFIRSLALFLSFGKSGFCHFEYCL